MIVERSEFYEFISAHPETPLDSILVKSVNDNLNRILIDHVSFSDGYGRGILYTNQFFYSDILYRFLNSKAKELRRNRLK